MGNGVDGALGSSVLLLFGTKGEDSTTAVGVERHHHDAHPVPLILDKLKGIPTIQSVGSPLVVFGVVDNENPFIVGEEIQNLGVSRSHWLGLGILIHHNHTKGTTLGLFQRLTHRVAVIPIGPSHVVGQVECVNNTGSLGQRTVHIVSVAVTGNVQTVKVQIGHHVVILHGRLDNQTVLESLFHAQNGTGIGTLGGTGDSPTIGGRVGACLWFGRRCSWLWWVLLWLLTWSAGWWLGLDGWWWSVLIVALIVLLTFVVVKVIVVVFVVLGLLVGGVGGWCLWFLWLLWLTWIGGWCQWRRG